MIEQENVRPIEHLKTVSGGEKALSEKKIEIHGSYNLTDR